MSTVTRTVQNDRYMYAIINAADGTIVSRLYDHKHEALGHLDKQQMGPHSMVVRLLVTELAHRGT